MKQRQEVQFDRGNYANELQVKAEEHEIAMEDIAAVREMEKHKKDEERMEIAKRLVEAKRQHELDLNEHRRKLDEVHNMMESRRQDWLDVQDYRAREAENRRKSVCFRLDSWRQQKLLRQKEKAKAKMIAEEEAFFKQMDHEDKLEAQHRAKEEEIKKLQLGSFHI